jgi:hypothetical protein
MTAVGQVRAQRTRKCRHSHRCGICGRQIAVGTLEGLVLSRGWCCVEPCILQRQQKATAT